jgi:uncharacterized protein with HEPN domain
MRQPDIRKFLFDIQNACTLISQFVAGKSFDDYRSDPLLRSGVERQFEILGEAMSQMMRVDPRMEEHFSDVGRIIAFRNYLIHGYSSVSDETVWGIVKKNLPVLVEQVEKTRTLLGP